MDGGGEEWGFITGVFGCSDVFGASGFSKEIGDGGVSPCPPTPGLYGLGDGVDFGDDGVSP